MTRDVRACRSALYWAALRWAVCATLLMVAVACQRPESKPPPTGSATTAGPYVPLYRAAIDNKESRGTIRGDFRWAAEAMTLEEAALRWQRYLGVHNPPGQEFEDNVQASYVSAAQYELARVYYLLGRREQGDALLRRLDPVGWEK